MTGARRLKLGRYWLWCGVFIAGLAMAFWLASLSEGSDDEPAAAAFVVGLSLLLLAQMARIAVYETPEALVVRNFFRRRRIPWSTVRAFGVKDYSWSPEGASVVVATNAGVVRLSATFTTSHAVATEIAATIEALGHVHGVPVEVDPEELRTRWWPFRP